MYIYLLFVWFHSAVEWLYYQMFARIRSMWKGNVKQIQIQTLGCVAVIGNNNLKGTWSLNTSAKAKKFLYFGSALKLNEFFMDNAPTLHRISWKSFSFKNQADKQMQLKTRMVLSRVYSSAKAQQSPYLNLLDPDFILIKIAPTQTFFFFIKIHELFNKINYNVGRTLISRC